MTIDEYLANVTPTQKAEFLRIRKIVNTTVKDVEEVISYGIPTFKHKSKYLLYFGAFKDHMSLFPGSALADSVSDKLEGYKISKGTIQFTEAKPIPEEIIKEILEARLKSITA